MKSVEQVARAAVLTAIAVAVLAAVLPRLFPYLVSLAVLVLIGRALWIRLGG